MKKEYFVPTSLGNIKVIWRIEYDKEADKIWGYEYKDKNGQIIGDDKGCFLHGIKNLSAKYQEAFLAYLASLEKLPTQNLQECACPSLALIGEGHLSGCRHFKGGWLSNRR